MCSNIILFIVGIVLVATLFTSKIYAQEKEEAE